MLKSLDRITVKADVCMGQPTIRGMRITVVFILKLMASGMTHLEILEAYPELEKDDLQQVIDFSDLLTVQHLNKEGVRIKNVDFKKLIRDIKKT